MSLHPATISITGTTPDGDPITLHTTLAGLDTGLTPVGDITIDWSRPTPLDHSDPADVHLEIRHPVTAPLLALDYDTRLVVTVTIAGAPVVVAVGWVTTWDRTVVNDTQAVYRITLADAVDRAESAKVSAPDTTWLTESNDARLNRIQPYAPDTPLVVPAHGNTPTGGLIGAAATIEPDGSTALELARGTMPPLMGLHPTTAGGLAGSDNGGWLSETPGVWGHCITRDDTGGVAVIPTDAVVDSGLRMTRAHRVTHVTIKAPGLDQEPWTYRWIADGHTGPASEQVVETDTIYGGPFPTDRTSARLRGILDAATSRVLLRPTRLIPSRVPAAELIRLLHLALRPVTLVYLDGPLAPHLTGLGRLHFITSGRITLTADGVIDYELEFIPAETGGVTTLTFGHLATHGQPTFRDFAALAGTPIPDTRRLTLRRSRAYTLERTT